MGLIKAAMQRRCWELISLSRTSFLLGYLQHLLSHHPTYLLLGPCLQLDQIITKRDSFFPALPKRRIFFLSHWCWVCLCDYQLWPPLGRVYISSQLDFEIIQVTSWANGVLADVMEAEAWNMLVCLGLFSCSSVTTMSRASSGYLLSLWPGCQKELCGAGLRPPDCKEPRPTIPTAWITAT